MAKRLQVIVQDPDYREIQRAARARHMTIAEWVRQALELARRREPVSSVEKKMRVIEDAVKHQFPAGDIAEMLADIESGYNSGMPE